MSIKAQIEEISKSQEPDATKQANYINILDSLTFNTVVPLHEFVSAVSHIPYGTSTSRDILTQFLARLQKQAPSVDFETDVLKFMLAEIEPLLSSFEAIDIAIRNRLVYIYEQAEDNIAASQVLETALSRSERRVLTNDEQFEWYIRIVRNRLEAEDATIAEQYLSKAALIRHRVKNATSESLTHFRLSQARIMDSNRRFLEAARKYYEVSVISEIQIDDDDRLACLAAAVKCIILTPAGPLRTQVLRLLYNDDRSRLLSDFDILEKVYMERLLLPAEVEAFGKELAPHQIAELPDGVTVLTRAIFDHNLLSVSRIYNNISFTELSKILALDKAKVEAYSAKMILQGRLKAVIDQVDDIIYFTSSESTTVKLAQWEYRVERMCSQMEDIVSDIQKKALAR
jgi:COP9 signalosome complex subunit 4